jgi:hypothetical protein
MKKNLLYLLIFVVLLSLVGYFLSQRNVSGTLEGQENYAFAVRDTASITKLVISDKRPSQAELTRTKNGWLLDGEYPVREDAIEVLLETLYRMEMRNFVSQRMLPTVEKNLEVYGKRVEIYQNGELSKVLTVGVPTTDEMGTYMKVEGGDAPYAVHIPGFNGFLNTRFITDKHLWRRRDLVRVNPRNIKEVAMIFPDSLSSSFRLRVFSPDSVYLVRASDEEVISDIALTKAKLYLSAFKNLRYEGEIVPSDPIYARRDSLKASTPAFKIQVKDVDGKLTTVTAYKIKAAPETIDEDDPSSYFDPDRLHGFINNDRMVLLQYYALRNVLKPLDHFRKE